MTSNEEWRQKVAEIRSQDNQALTETLRSLDQTVHDLTEIIEAAFKRGNEKIAVQATVLCDDVKSMWNAASQEMSRRRSAATVEREREM